jgi:hypothetical protein
MNMNMKTEDINQELEFLANQLKASRLPEQPAPAEFRQNLLSSLINQFDTPHLFLARRWAFGISLVSLAVIVLLFLILASPMGPQPVMASDLLQQANLAFMAQVNDEGITYEKMALTTHTGMVSQDEALLEIWHSPNGQIFRFQLSSQNGDLLYLVQRQWNQIWRSFHTQPVGVEPVGRIYRMHIDQLENAQSLAALDHQNIGLQTSFGFFSMAAQGLDSCSDLYCILGIQGQQWKCLSEVCTLFHNDQEVVEARLHRDERLENGRDAHVVEIRPVTGPGISQVVKIDTETLAIIEILHFDRETLIDRLQLIERRTLDNTEIKTGFFYRFPAGIDVVMFDDGNPSQDEPVGETGTNRLWLVSVSPDPGTAFEQTTEFKIELGYELVSAPEAVVKVLLWPAWVGWPGGSTEGSENTTVTRGMGTVQISFSASPQTLHPGQWQLLTHMGTFQGSQLVFFAYKEWGDYQWCVGCSP